MPKLQWNLKFVDITDAEASELVLEGLAYRSEDPDILYPEDDVSLTYVEEKVHHMRKDGIE